MLISPRLRDLSWLAMAAACVSKRPIVHNCDFGRKCRGESIHIGTASPLDEALSLESPGTRWPGFSALVEAATCSLNDRRAVLRPRLSD